MITFIKIIGLALCLVGISVIMSYTVNLIWLAYENHVKKSEKIYPELKTFINLIEEYAQEYAPDVTNRNLYNKGMIYLKDIQKLRISFVTYFNHKDITGGNIEGSKFIEVVYFLNTNRCKIFINKVDMAIKTKILEVNTKLNEDEIKRINVVLEKFYEEHSNYNTKVGRVSL